MSGTMFANRLRNSVDTLDGTPIPSERISSRIPISSLPSPTPMRRSASLRLRGENHKSIIRLLKNADSVNETNKSEKHKVENLKSPSIALTRGHSFCEKSSNTTKTGYRRENSSGVVRPNYSKTEQQRNLSTPKGVHTPLTPRRKTLSLSVPNTKHSNPNSPTVTCTSPYSPYTNPANSRDWDLDSITSTASNFSIASSCDHASVARNGTTFSGKSMRYVFHCNQHAGAVGEDYLTPTQRAHRQVKKLKSLLNQAQVELEQKDSDILKLTKEVVELRLYKAALGSPEDRSNSSDAVTVRENHTEDQITPDTDLLTDSVAAPNHTDLSSSYTDSGLYEDLNSSQDNTPLHSNKSGCDKAVEACFLQTGINPEHDKLLVEYEKRFQELIKTHEEDTHQLKQKQNDKVEELLQRIADINQRYWQLVPELEAAKARIKDLETELEETCKKLEDQDSKQKQTNLDMYNQGHEAARIERETQVMELVKKSPNRVSVPELLHELQITKNELDNIRAMYRQLMEAKSKNKIDPEVTLQFLKSAIYYFLTDKENTNGHLKAIQSILGFTPSEISNIDKARLQ